MRIRFQILLICYCVSLHSRGQEPPNQAQLAIEQFRQGSGLVNTFDHRYEGVKGIPFFAEDWLPGFLQLQEDYERTSGVKLHVDIYNQDVYVMPATGHSFFKLESLVHAIYLIQDDDTVKFIGVDADRIQQALHPHYYLQEMWKGAKLGFYRMPFKILHKADYKGAYANGDRYDEFIPDELWYIFDGEDYHKVKLNHKALTKTFPEMQDLIRKEKISTAADLIEALKSLDKGY